MSATRQQLLRIGNESARDLMSAYPGEFTPTDYVHADVWRNGAVTGVTITASYTPVGHGIASVASRQAIDAAARRALPGARFDGPDRTTNTYGAFQLGARIRQYTAPIESAPMPAWVGDAIPGDTGAENPLTGPFAL